MQAWDLLVQRDGDTLAMSESAGFATAKDIGAYHLRNLLKAANVPDVEASVAYIQGKGKSLSRLEDCLNGHVVLL